MMMRLFFFVKGKLHIPRKDGKGQKDKYDCTHR